jgi:hypothetical protein
MNQDTIWVLGEKCKTPIQQTRRRARLIQSVRLRARERIRIIWRFIEK